MCLIRSYIKGSKKVRPKSICINLYLCLSYISKDFQKRGMKFVGSTIIYSYLQAIGIIYSHERDCYLFCKVDIKTKRW